MVCSRLPSSCLKSPLTGSLNREWRVWPSTLNAATPVGAVTHSWPASRSFRHRIKYDLPVPAVPEMISLSGVA